MTASVRRKEPARLAASGKITAVSVIRIVGVLRQKWTMMNSIRSLIAALWLLCLPSLARADPVDEIVEREMARGQVPGVAIAIVRGGRQIRTQGYGFANLEHRVPVHPDTVFKGGAVGMQFTAAAIMLLVEDGKLALDAPVRQYLPELPASWQPVTVRQMLNHTSGLPATPNGDFRVDYTDAQLLSIIAHEDLNFRAGTRWRFSYADYIVLGFVVKRVTGEYYTDFLKTRIFAPLGMRSTRGIDELAIIPNRAAGYELRDGSLRNAEWVSATANSTADGSLYLSVLDYGAWAAALSRQGVLSASSWAVIGKPAQLLDGTTCGYGAGWYLDKAGTKGSWWHSGSWQGFQSFAAHFIGEDLSVMVLANGEGADAETMARQIASVIDPTLARAQAQPSAEAAPVVSIRVAKLLGDIAANRFDRASFTDFATLDLTELTAQYAQLLAPLGTVQEVALFDKRQQCGDTAYRYRVRYQHGMIEVRLGLAQNGRIGNLEIVPVHDWSAPL
ncbi:MAG: serine hydrolase domain-containing protein [Sphingobium sp.]